MYQIIDKPLRYYLDRSTPLWSKEASEAFLNLKDFNVVASRSNDHSVETVCVPDMQYLYPPNGVPVCTECGVTSRSVHKVAVRKLMHTPIHDKPHTLYVVSPVYKCTNSSCAATTFTVQLKCALPRERVTESVSDYIITHGLGTDSLKSVTKRCGLSPTEGYSIRLAEAKRRNKYVRYQATKHMGIDETMLSIKGKHEKTLCITVMATRPGQCAVEKYADLPSYCNECLDEDQKFETGVASFERMSRDEESITELLYRFEDYDKIETMTMDMTAAFINAMHTVNPKTIVIIDRFHVIKSLNEKTCAVATRIYAKTKRKLLKQEEEIKCDPGYDPNKLKEVMDKLKILNENYNNKRYATNAENISSRGRAAFARLRTVEPALYDIYELKEKLRYDFYEAETKEDAWQIADKCREMLPPIPSKKSGESDSYVELRTFFKSLMDSVFTEGIFNYFLYPKGHRYTNAALENFHKYLKEYTRQSKNLSYDVLRLCVLHGKLSRKIEKSPYTRKDVENAIFHLYMSLQGAATYPMKVELNRIVDFQIQHDPTLAGIAATWEKKEDNSVYFDQMRCLQKVLARDINGNCKEDDFLYYEYEIFKIHPLADLVKNEAFYVYLGNEDSEFIEAASKEQEPMCDDEYYPESSNYYCEYEYLNKYMVTCTERS